MAVNIGQKIGEAEYTTLRSGINLVMGTPTGTGTGAAGYNQAITAPAISPGDKITAAAWNALKADIEKAYTHQTGVAYSPALPTAAVGSNITKDIHDRVETAVDFIKSASNRFLLGSGQSTVVSASSRTKTNWNGTQVHDVTFTWADANSVKAFFNAGGYLRFVTTLTGGSGAKYLDWKSMVDGVGTVEMNYVNVSKSGASGTVINDGYYDLNTTARYLVSKAGSTPYAENDYQIEARSITNGVRIRLIYRDDDVGDQRAVVGAGPAGPAVDENVNGTLTSSISYIRPTGSNVSVAAPTVALGTSNTF